MKNVNTLELTYWNYESDTYMVKIPFDNILLFKKILKIKTKKEATENDFLSKYFVYKEGLKGSPIFIQSQFKRDEFEDFLKKNKKELKIHEVKITKLSQ